MNLQNRKRLTDLDKKGQLGSLGWTRTHCFIFSLLNSYYFIKIVKNKH